MSTNGREMISKYDATIDFAQNCESAIFREFFLKRTIFKIYLAIFVLYNS